HVERPLGAAHDGVGGEDIDEIRGDELLLRYPAGVDQRCAGVVLPPAATLGGVRCGELSGVAVDAWPKARSDARAGNVDTILFVDVDAAGRADGDVQLAVVYRSGRD